MAAATDQQMQRYCDERIRPRAEQWRLFVNSLRDDKNAITEVFERASSDKPWVDGRTDGPPKMLASDDVLAYNTFITALLEIADGVQDTPEEVKDPRAEIDKMHNNAATVMAACVRPL